MRECEGSSRLAHRSTNSSSCFALPGSSSSKVWRTVRGSARCEGSSRSPVSCSGYPQISERRSHAQVERVCSFSIEGLRPPCVSAGSRSAGSACSSSGPCLVCPTQFGQCAWHARPIVPFVVGWRSAAPPCRTCRSAHATAHRQASMPTISLWIGRDSTSADVSAWRGAFAQNCVWPAVANMYSTHRAGPRSRIGGQHVARARDVVIP